jgi:hypothetical protein
MSRDDNSGLRDGSVRVAHLRRVRFNCTAQSTWYRASATYSTTAAWGTAVVGIR